MIRSTDRILTSHAGALPRSDDLRDLVAARAAGRPYDEPLRAQRLRQSVADVVKKQVECGVDSVNDGEQSKTNFTNYVRERLGGFETRVVAPRAKGPPPLLITGRDIQDFPEYFAGGRRWLRGPAGLRGAAAPARRRSSAPARCSTSARPTCRTDIDNFKAALAGVDVRGLPARHSRRGPSSTGCATSYYKSDEEFLFAIADAMHEEYKAIADAGLILQIDDPDLPDGWQMFPEMSVGGLPQIRPAARRGAQPRPARHPGRPDAPARLLGQPATALTSTTSRCKDIVDIVFSGQGRHAISIEASNPRHEHEWHVFEDFKLPDGQAPHPRRHRPRHDFIEHPELIAERLVRYAKLVGRENVIAGTDCGLGPRVGHPASPGPSSRP